MLPLVGVARQPNCVTRTVQHLGELKVMIYSKRPIAAGEELCYDYKFPHALPGEERITCYCGAYNCRGYMN